MVRSTTKIDFASWTLHPGQSDGHREEHQQVPQQVIFLFDYNMFFGLKMVFTCVLVCEGEFLPYFEV